MRMKRTIAALLCAMLLTALLPGAAFAAGDKAIQLGTGGVNANDKVYFGKYGTYDVPWIVLPSGTLSETTTITGALPLLSEYLLGNSQFRALDDWGYYNIKNTGNTPNSSILKETLESYYNGTNKLFTNAEQNAVADTELTGNSMYGGQAALPGQKLFPLSQEEAGSLTWGSNILQAKYRDTGSAGGWWSRFSHSRGTVFCMDVGGNSSTNPMEAPLGVRPAFNLDLSSVLFTAAADNSGQNAAFSAPVAYSGTDWKLTLKDGNSFAAGTAKTSGNTALTTGYAAQALTFSHAALSSFTGAGYTNVTAALTNTAGDLLYYGSINTAADATSSSVTIPAGLAAGSYTLSLYAEDRNAVHTTDYATGVPFTQTITVAAPTELAFTKHPQSQSKAEGDSVTFSADVTGTAPISLRWRRSTDNGLNWYIIAGETGTSYTISAVDFAMNKFQYRCEASDRNYAWIASEAATLTVIPLAVYDLQFAANTEFTDVAAKTIDFGTVRQGYSQPVGKYVIIKNDGNTSVKLLSPAFSPASRLSNYTVVVQTGWGNETGAAEARNFSLQPNSNLPTGNYDASITIGCTDENGNPISASCTMYVKFTVTAAIQITTQPADQYVVVGQQATFSISATGDGLTYQWYINRNDGSGWQALSGKTGTSHTNTPVTPKNNGYQYSCLVTDAHGNTLRSGIAALHVSPVVVPPQTGDNSKPLLWLGMCLLGGLGLALTMRKKRRA